MTNRRTQLHIRIILKCPDPRSNTHQPVLFLTSILDQGSDQVEVSQSDPHGEVSLKCNQHLIANTEPFKTQPDPRSQGAVQLITSVPTCDQGSVQGKFG